jgi:hypothetical protein
VRDHDGDVLFDGVRRGEHVPRRRSSTRPMHVHTRLCISDNDVLGVRGQHGQLPCVRGRSQLHRKCRPSGCMFLFRWMGFQLVHFGVVRWHGRNMRGVRRRVILHWE